MVADRPESTPAPTATDKPKREKPQPTFRRDDYLVTVSDDLRAAASPASTPSRGA